MPNSQNVMEWMTDTMQDSRNYAGFKKRGRHDFDLLGGGELASWKECMIQDKTEVMAEYCGENIFCHSPYRCCELSNGCCYDSTLHTNRHLRMQIWNMWYFWFLIIFMMISCFGWYGYYRRRRLAMLTARSGGVSPGVLDLAAGGGGNISDDVDSLNYQWRRRLRRSSDRRGVTGNSTRLNMYGYNASSGTLELTMSIPTGTGATVMAAMPPAYSEVVRHPGLFPVADNKSDLPPYPGYKPEDGAVDSSEPLPPPYSEHPIPVMHQSPTATPLPVDSEQVEPAQRLVVNGLALPSTALATSESQPHSTST